MGFLPNPSAEGHSHDRDINLPDDYERPEDMQGFVEMVPLVRSAHGIMKALIANDRDAVEAETVKINEVMISMGVTKLTDRTAILSLVMVAASQISPKMYGGDTDW